jgi:hypothetical protein
MNPASRTTVLALAAVFAASSLAYFGVSTYRKRELHKAVAELVKDASQRLEQALAIEKDATAANSPQIVTRLDDQAQEVDKHVIELRSMSAAPDRALADAAEEYLLTVRQILRNQAASHRYLLQVTASDQALRDHMRKAGVRSRGWIDEAMREKEQMERAYFNYRLSSDAFGRLLDSYPDARGKLAAQMEARRLFGDDASKDARKRAAAASKRVADEVERTRQLAGVR